MKNSTLSQNTITRDDFMRQVGLGFGAIILTQCISSCGGEDIPLPDTNANAFKLVLDLAAVSNKQLEILGGYVVVNSEGRKIIVARTKDDTYIAVAGNCSHANNELTFSGTNNKFDCSLHGSTFTTTGAVINGPATTALKKYITIVDKTSKTVTISEK